MKRRLRCYYTTPDCLLFWLTQFGENLRRGECQTFPRLDLPTGAKVTHFFLAHARAQVGFVVEHESFEEIDSAVEPPAFDIETKLLLAPRNATTQKNDHGT